MAIDLGVCDPGDILISRHGAKLIYIKPLKNNAYDHLVEYVDVRGDYYGTRTNSGYVYKKLEKRKPRYDDDIVKIIKIFNYIIW